MPPIGGWRARTGTATATAEPEAGERKRNPAGKLAGEMAADEARVYGSMPATALCGVPGCEEWRFEGTADECKVAFADHEREQHPNLASKRRREKAERVRAEALERAAARRAELEAREARRRVARPAPTPPAEPEPEPAAEPVPVPDDPPARRRWTEESTLAALQVFIDRVGHPPANRDLQADEALPSGPTLKRFHGGLGEAVVKLGWPRPTRSTRYERDGGSAEAAETGAVAAESAATEPEAPLAAGIPPEPEPLVEAQPEAPARLVPDGQGEAVVRMQAVDADRKAAFVDGIIGRTERPPPIDTAVVARRAWLMILDGMRDLVDVYYPEG